MEHQSQTIGGDALQQKSDRKSEDLEYWMTRLPEPLKNLPIIYLAIPGSHNTMTYTINRRNEVGPDEPRYVKALGRYVSFLSKPVIYNWSVTQQKHVKDQLDGGIRYLDLRVATKPTDKRVYFVHGLYGSTIYEPLQEIAQWLSSHNRETVILDFQHFYLFAEEDHRHLIDTIFRIFRTKLCPVTSTFNFLTLNRLNAEAHQVIVIYRNVYAQNYSTLWPSMLWRTPWPNTVNVNQLINFLDTELKGRSVKTGLVSQCLLTPDAAYVLKHLCGTLQRDLVQSSQKAVIAWINGKRPGEGGFNIVITDFVDDNNFLFSKTVIDSNRKLFNHQYRP